MVRLRLYSCTHRSNTEQDNWKDTISRATNVRLSSEPVRGLKRFAAFAFAFVALSLWCSSCGGPDHSAEHDAVVAGLPEISGVELVDTSRSTFCTTDSCPFGGDAMSSTYTYRVSESGPAERDLITAFASAYPDAEVQICETLDADPERCVFEVDHRASASFTIDEWSVYVDTLNWGDATYTVQLRNR